MIGDFLSIHAFEGKTLQIFNLACQVILILCHNFASCANIHFAETSEEESLK